MKKIKVAITGNIGSGKSTFSDYLINKGFAVINADGISKNLLQTNEIIRKEVITTFGKGSYSGDKLNKKYIAEVVFSNPVKLKELNSILHPAVLAEINSIINKKYSDEKIIFIETALVYESNIADQFDYVVLITSDFNLRLKRGTGKNKFNESDFRRREHNQIPDSEKEKKADFIFSNNNSKVELFKKAELLLLTLGIRKI
jgi:dephospho-CoA kinase